MTAPDPIRPICPICQTPLARERQTQTVQPDNSDAVTEKEFDVWVCPKDRSHEPELHITDV
jgi:YgiT-type zinc finger domain-containing protein